MTIYGTHNEAIANMKHIYDEICDNETSNKKYVNNTSSEIVAGTPSLSSKTEKSIVIGLSALVVFCPIVCVIFIFYQTRCHIQISFLLPTSKVSLIPTNIDNDVQLNLIKPLCENNEAFMKDNDNLQKVCP